MPAKSKAQRRMMAADRERARKGQTTRTGMTTAQLSDYVRTSEKGLPKRVKRKKRA